jgi:signal transduction histidine kinase
MWPGQVWLTYDLDRVHQGSWREDACVESPEPHLVLPQLRLDDLLAELQSRLQTVRDTRDRVRGLLEAVIAVGDRIARDLHDQVIQRLYASGMKLQGTIPLITRPLVEERVSGVVDDLDKTITDIRTAIFSLQARGTDVAGLRRKVADVVDEMTERTA